MSALQGRVFDASGAVLINAGVSVHNAYSAVDSIDSSREFFRCGRYAEIRRFGSGRRR
jgi:hypothetical protein